MGLLMRVSRSFRQILNSNSVSSNKSSGLWLINYQITQTTTLDCPELLFEAPTLLLSQSTAEMCLMGSSSPDLFYSTWPGMLRWFQQWAHLLMQGKNDHQPLGNCPLLFGEGNRSQQHQSRGRGEAQGSDFIPATSSWITEQWCRWTPVNTPEGHINHLTTCTLSRVHKEKNQPFWWCSPRLENEVQTSAILQSSYKYYSTERDESSKTLKDIAGFKIKERFAK